MTTVSGHLRRLHAQAAGHQLPFLLDVDHGHRIEIPPPDSRRLGQLLTMRPDAPLRYVVDVICGAAAADVLTAVAGDDVLVLEAILEDVRDHFAVRHAGRVGGMLDRYGDHLQADLRALGVDVLDLWRGRISVDEISNLIDHLPRTSAFQDALAHDEEYAALAAGTDSKPTPPRLTEFGPEIELLAALYDRVGELIGTVVQVAGGKGHHHARPYPRPVTAIDRARAARRAAGAEDLLNQLLPNRPRR